MTEPAYVAIAGEYARRIRSGALTAGTQLPSYAEIGSKYDVSDIVVRKAVELLLGQGLVRSVRRRGIFVTDRPNLVRVSPERQTEDPEVTFSNESDQEIRVHRDVNRVPVTGELAEIFSVLPGETVVHTVTRASEGGRPVSISDTYQPEGIEGTSSATALEETLSDRMPRPSHAEWLQTMPGELVKTVHQRFLTSENATIMLSDVSYPRDRYEAFVFRMELPK